MGAAGWGAASVTTRSADLVSVAACPLLGRLLGRLVSAGRLGRKVGRGFRGYSKCLPR
ncbi:hypothetical protein GCM10017581_106000 [Dactylosporangium matsuzakiense]|uniref:Uncharacterized protein n=1 Tax=Dactylosporangium matsuzakiense TaxID=53360 RepID=A0A9W6KX47_9ACTN|nr:hypothetical protein GCM10017581_106000 [Dactylosporangium matsuzakiense]